MGLKLHTMLGFIHRVEHMVKGEAEESVVSGGAIPPSHQTRLYGKLPTSFLRDMTTDYTLLKVWW